MEIGEEEMEKDKTAKIIILSILLYFLSTGVSFATFAYLRKPVTLITPLSPEEIGPSEGVSKFNFDPKAPKTEASLLNGVLYSKEQMAYLLKRRPLGIMIENHQEARPQSGLSSADIVYEAVAEGGITRFLAIFWGVFDDFIVGPVRSARTYYLDWISEYAGLYAHVGGAHCDINTGEGCQNGAPADALGQIERYGIKSLNQFYLGFPTFWRDYERLGRRVATEHTVYSTPDKLWQKAKERGWEAVDSEGKDWQEDFTPWQFKDEDPLDKRPEFQKIEFGFWEGYNEYRVRWEYERLANVYKRFNGGQLHKDLNNDQQLSAKNVVVQFVSERQANDGYPDNVHLLYGTIGQGKAIVFQDGKKIEGKWVKKDRESRTRFYDSLGKEIEFNRGQIWIEILPVGTEVNVS